MKTKKRFKGIDAASMADVAFLLLIFFMIVTKINQDKGLLVKLPANEEPKPSPIHERNVLKIYLNDENELLVGNEATTFVDLHNKIYAHLNNYGEDENMSVHPQKAVIVFEQSRGASYQDYLKIQNEIKVVYKELRNELSLLWTNQITYEDILKRADDDSYYEQLKDSIHKEIPMHVQEALPSAVL